MTNNWGKIATGIYNDSKALVLAPLTSDQVVHLKTRAALGDKNEGKRISTRIFKEIVGEFLDPLIKYYSQKESSVKIEHPYIIKNKIFNPADNNLDDYADDDNANDQKESSVKIEHPYIIKNKII
jgi:hypothetical protein